MSNLYYCMAMSISSGVSSHSLSSIRRLSQSSESASVDRYHQPLSTPVEEPLLYHFNFVNAMATVEFPDMYLEKRLCDRESSKSDEHMGATDAEDFLYPLYDANFYN